MVQRDRTRGTRWTPGETLMERRRFLDEDFVLQRISLEQIQELLRPLARTDLSTLPARMRTACARMHRQCAALARELRRAPDAVRAERQREDEAAARRPPPP